MVSLFACERSPQSDQCTDNNCLFGVSDPLKVTGDLDDCACDVETIDGFNNDQLFPKLQTLLESDYFRFYKVSVIRPVRSNTRPEAAVAVAAC